MESSKWTPVLVDGEWRAAQASKRFNSLDPTSGDTLAAYPISEWNDIDLALGAGKSAFPQVANHPERVAVFLNALAGGVERESQRLVETAKRETALSPSRLVRSSCRGQSNSFGSPRRAT